MEALRFSPVVPGVVRRTTQATKLRDGPQTTQIAEGELVYADYASAMQDATAFPKPEEIQATRNIANYKPLLGGYFKKSSECLFHSAPSSGIGEEDVDADSPILSLQTSLTSRTLSLPPSSSSRRSVVAVSSECAELRLTRCPPVRADLQVARSPP